ncbi:helix-turn-helix domain-containing protein [Chloroflexota bacterium]
MKGEEVKCIRERLSWSQKQLADELGVARATVNRWEVGRRRPSPLAAEKLKECLEEKEGATKTKWTVKRAL